MPRPINLIDLTIEPGKPGMPMIVFVHGLGMTSRIWTSPSEELMLGGMLRIGTLLGNGDMHKTLWHDIGVLGFGRAVWSHRRPVGPVSAAVRELDALMRSLEGVSASSVIIIGHSRGGLIARAWLKGLGPEDIARHRVSGLITVNSPHLGSALARWAEKLRPAAKAIKDHIPGQAGQGRAEFSKGLTRALRFLSSTGVQELLPGSGFLASLPEALPEGVKAYSTGGTSPSFISRGGFSFPDTLVKFLPASMQPDELAEGKGDGLVSARSALLRLRDSLGHEDFPCNHLTVLTSPEVRRALLGVIQERFVR